MTDFTEITATTMDPAWITYERGKPGTIAHMHGGTWWCARCFALNVSDRHVCADIERGARRWVIRPAAGTHRADTQQIHDRIDAALDGYITWDGNSPDAADSETTTTTLTPEELIRQVNDPDEQYVGHFAKWDEDGPGDWEAIRDYLREHGVGLNDEYGAFALDPDDPE
ncbi:MAG: hypothetical protein M0030_13035 [Actinomycetota bacterium]|nr:hypothetical protein [Actinomycetota bacterium]